tara:strand:- start:43817 stop:43966 length:150 start_codon:yes stop_codon:yes gene_type:complete
LPGGWVFGLALIEFLNALLILFLSYSLGAFFAWRLAFLALPDLSLPGSK